MRVAAALLCDAASVREGLVHVLGGGLNLLRRHAFPASLGVTLVFVPEVPEDEATNNHKVTVRVRERGGTEEVARVDGEWAPDSDPEHADLPSYVPLVIPLNQVAVPQPGAYELVLELDEEEVAVITFKVLAASGGDAKPPA